MKTRILFVDDEFRILEGLQRSLRNMGGEWEMSFAGSGQEALDTLNQKTFDVVVSDIRMPGMDGGEFLTEVKRRFPQIVRIILSGHSDDEFIMKSVKVAHQYLAKPCDTETLKSMVMRTSRLRCLLADEPLRRVLSGIDTLPSLPSLYAEIIEELHSPEVSIQKIGKIISRDLGMTAKILQLVNSAFFGLRHRVSSPSQAVSLLGINTTRGLILSMHIFSQFDVSERSTIHPERLWNHSFHSGVMAKAIAQEENQTKMPIDDSFLAGLLHDLGKPILSIYAPEGVKEARQRARDKKIPLWGAEKEIFGVSHSEVGAYLVGLWGLPDPIVEALAFHHDPASWGGQGFSPLLSVHVANALEQEGNPSDLKEIRPQINRDFLAGLNYLSRLSRWEEACRKAIQGGRMDE